MIKRITLYLNGSYCYFKNSKQFLIFETYLKETVSLSLFGNYNFLSFPEKFYKIHFMIRILEMFYKYCL